MWDGLANTLTGFDYGGPARQVHWVAHETGFDPSDVEGFLAAPGPLSRMRTFTLTEWERLNGMPDGWTEGVPENARAQILGNMFVAPHGFWFGRRLMRKIREMDGVAA